MPEATADLPALESAYRDAQADLDAYVATVTDRYRQQFPDPAGPDGTPRWDEGQALLRRAWSEAEHAELERLRGVASEAMKAVWRARGL